MGLLGNQAASLDGGVIWRAAEKAGLPTDNETLNKIVALINGGLDAETAAMQVKSGKPNGKPSGGLLGSQQGGAQPVGGK